MKTSIYDFILTPENDVVYKNKIEVGDNELILNTHIGVNDKDLLQIQGKVVNAPLYNRLSVKEGDRVIVQHNTFRVWSDRTGQIQHGSILEDGQYFVSNDLIFAYDSGDGWISTGGWVFLKPEEFQKDGVLKSEKTYRPDKGIIAFEQDPYFKDETLQVGDDIHFRTGKRVTTSIDGETYFRVRIKDILLNNDRST